MLIDTLPHWSYHRITFLPTSFYCICLQFGVFSFRVINLNNLYVCIYYDFHCLWVNRQLCRHTRTPSESLQPANSLSVFHHFISQSACQRLKVTHFGLLPSAINYVQKKLLSTVTLPADLVRVLAQHQHRAPSACNVALRFFPFILFAGARG